MESQAGICLSFLENQIRLLTGRKPASEFWMDLAWTQLQDGMRRTWGSWEKEGHPCQDY